MGGTAKATRGTRKGTKAGKAQGGKSRRAPAARQATNITTALKRTARGQAPR